MISTRIHRTLVWISLLCPMLALSSELPKRASPTPATTKGVPHIQLNVQSDSALASTLLARINDIKGVDIRESVISLPGARGFWLEDSITITNPKVIVRGREFAHLHPDGSLHASLPPDLAQKAIATGWATPHPWANKREGWQGFVMIHTPTSEKELDVVYQLVLASYDFVTNSTLSVY